ncbi:MAG: histidinol phosphate phosphatase domain-containing protein [Spirochaetales bacterium]|nr:histidinol phosphate phosphatase domain-containing protein [Spirochaetales bacterium]
MTIGIIDLHTHSFFSDGVLSPAELVQRAVHAGYTGIAITDHVDASNCEHVIGALKNFCLKTNPYLSINVIPGVEITHVPPGQIKELVVFARRAGAKLVVLHGETICEPVPPGTNKAGIEAGIDILAHPGLITAEEAALAAEKGVYLEITARRSHGLGNGRVLEFARKYSAPFVLNTDAHSPGDLFSEEWRKKVAFGAGMTEAEYDTVNKTMKGILQKLAPGYHSV